MTARAFFAFLLLSLQGALSLSAAERFHLEPALPSQLRPLGAVAANQTDAASTPSGGNVSAPSATGGAFQLVESSIGYLGPTTEVGLNTKNALNSLAEASLTSGTNYKQNGIPGNWQVVFPGVVDVATGNEVAGEQNFHPDRVQIAIDLYRVNAKAFPNDLQTRINLINALREFMTPHIYAGNNAYARATKERVIDGSGDLPVEQGNPSAIGRELQKLQQAIAAYDVAIDQFVDAASSADTAPCILANSLPPGTGETNALATQYREAQNLLGTHYARALFFKGEALLRSLHLRYIQAYDSTTATQPIGVQALMSEVDVQSQKLDYQLILIMPLEQFPWFPGAQFASGRTFLGHLRDLKSAMQAGSLTFASTSSDLNVSSNVYTPQFVPFMFEPTEFANPTTFSGLIGAANNSATRSEQQDAFAASSIGQLDLNLQSLATRLNEVHDQFNSQLGQLCGYKDIEDNGGTRQVPDIDGAILPPEHRPGWELRPTELDRGAIGEQWYVIDAVELGVQKALDDLDSHLKAIDKKRNAWQQIEQSQETMIQDVIIGTGQKIDQLNKEAIEARAKFAEYQARLAQKKRKRGFFGGVIGGIVGIAAAVIAPYAAPLIGATIAPTAATTAVLGSITSAVSSISQAATQYSIAGLEIKELRSQADLDRRLGEINAKKEELAYLERAAIHFNQIEVEGYRVEEAIHAMMLQTKALEIQIEMAELNVDREYAKLSSMLNRVSYLLQQQAASLSLVNSNPLNSPDFRIIRDRDVRQAEEQFVFAQEQAFLAGRAAYYSMVSATRRQNVANINASILQARTGRRLAYLLGRLQQQAYDQVSELGTRTPVIVQIKIRDHLVQHNHVVRNVNGAVDFELPVPWEPQGVIPAGSTAQKVSDDDWRAFLRSRLDSRGALVIPFRLSWASWTEGLTRLPDGGRLQNPLFARRNFGARIFYKDGAGSGYFGTRINIHGSGFDGLHPNFFPIRAYLTPEGSSYVRTRSYESDPLGQSQLIYQLGTRGATAAITCSIGGSPPDNNFNPQLHERTPANDRWVLEIDPSEAGNGVLLGNHLDKISEISITFSLSAYSN